MMNFNKLTSFKIYLNSIKTRKVMKLHVTNR